MSKLMGIMKAPFMPLSYLWDGLYRLRRFSYNYSLLKKNSFNVPIISIGNLSFGGTGKTPCTLWFAEFLIEKNLAPMILMRGYKGAKEKSSFSILKNNLDAIDTKVVGDEAALLANRLPQVPIVIGKNRSENLRHYFPKYLPDVILLDDGHQHMSLGRDLNIVLFDALMSTQKYKTPPFGYLREGLSALRDADVILFSRADQVTKKKINELKQMFSPYVNSSVVYGEFRYVPRGFYNREFEFVFSLDQLQGKSIYATCGIGSPESFYNLLESLGLNIVQKETFPDHHNYINEDIKSLIEQAKNNDSYVITTEKDMIKLESMIQSERLLYLDIQLDFLEGQKKVEEIIDKTIQ